MKILLIEDEQALGASINSYLKDEGYVCEWVKTFAQAQEKVELYAYDLLLVDIMLPGGSGLDIVQQIKDLKSNSGIIIISAKNSVEDKIAGLDIGADDYLPKPFSFAELNSRIRSVLRRRNFEGSNELVFNEIKIDPSKNTVMVNDQVTLLTKKEYDLLLFFMINKDKVITKESIAEHLWGDNMDMNDSFDFIYTHIKNLRKKLMDMGSADYVRTVYGMGYRFGNK